jgi:hypothetical protein
MIKRYLTILLLFIAWVTLSLKTDDQFMALEKLVQNKFHINQSNYTVILINNGVCGGLCEAKLYNFIKNKIPIQHIDSIFFLIEMEDSSLISTLKPIEKKRILDVSRNTLIRYGILTGNHLAIQIKNGKIIKKQKLNAKSTFNNWSI